MATKISAEYVKVGMTLKTFGKVYNVERKSFLGTEMVTITATHDLKVGPKKYGFHPKETVEVIED